MRQGWLGLVLAIRVNRWRYRVGIVIPPPKAAVAMLASAVPLAFRLATLKLQGAPEAQITEAIEQSADNPIVSCCR